MQTQEEDSGRKENFTNDKQKVLPSSLLSLLRFEKAVKT